MSQKYGFAVLLVFAVIPLAAAPGDSASTPLYTDNVLSGSVEAATRSLPSRESRATKTTPIPPVTWTPRSRRSSGSISMKSSTPSILSATTTIRKS